MAIWVSACKWEHRLQPKARHNGTFVGLNPKQCVARRVCERSARLRFVRHNQMCVTRAARSLVARMCCELLVSNEAVCFMSPMVSDELLKSWQTVLLACETIFARVRYVLAQLTALHVRVGALSLHIESNVWFTAAKRQPRLLITWLRCASATTMLFRLTTVSIGSRHYWWKRSPLVAEPQYHAPTVFQRSKLIKLLESVASSWAELRLG